MIHFCSVYSRQIISEELGAHLRCVCTCIKIIKYLRGCDVLLSHIMLCSEVWKSAKTLNMSQIEQLLQL